MDRIQAYGAEDPVKGAYVHIEKGETPDEGPLRDTWKNTLRQEAHAAGNGSRHLQRQCVGRDL